MDDQQQPTPEPEQYPVAAPGVKDRARAILERVQTEHSQSLPPFLRPFVPMFLKAFDSAPEETIAAALEVGADYIDFILYGDQPQEG